MMDTGTIRSVLEAVYRDWARAKNQYRHLTMLKRYLERQLERAEASDPSDNGTSTRLQIIPVPLADQAAQALADLGGEASTPQVLEQMVQHGFVVEHDRPRSLNSIYYAMVRDPRFAKVGRGRWKLQGADKQAE